MARVFRTLLVVLSVMSSHALHAQFGAAKQADPPQVTFERDGVIASGVTPDAEVVFFSVAREPKGYSSLIRRRQGIERDLDRDGIVRFAVTPSLPRKSVWAVLDMSSGLVTITGPPGFDFSKLAIPGNRIKRGLTGKLDRLELDEGWVEILFARPGVGAWTLTMMDGAPIDEDRNVDGKFILPLERMQAVKAGLPVPDEVRNGDVLVVIDTSELDVTSIGGLR